MESPDREFLSRRQAARVVSISWPCWTPRLADPLNRVHRTPFRLVGQAKRYKGEVDGDKVAAFCGRVEECRRGQGKGWEKLPPWFQKRQDPIIGLLVTTGTIGPSARRAAREHVVLIFEGEQVADDLRRSSLFASWVDTAGEFDGAEFLAYATGLGLD